VVPLSTSWDPVRPPQFWNYSPTARMSVGGQSGVHPSSTSFSITPPAFSHHFKGCATTDSRRCGRTGPAGGCMASTVGVARCRRVACDSSAASVTTAAARVWSTEVARGKATAGSEKVTEGKMIASNHQINAVRRHGRDLVLEAGAASRPPVSQSYPPTADLWEPAPTSKRNTAVVSCPSAARPLRRRRPYQLEGTANGHYPDLPRPPPSSPQAGVRGAISWNRGACHRRGHCAVAARLQVTSPTSTTTGIISGLERSGSGWYLGLVRIVDPPFPANRSIRRSGMLWIGHRRRRTFMQLLQSRYGFTAAWPWGRPRACTPAAALTTSAYLGGGLKLNTSSMRAMPEIFSRRCGNRHLSTIAL